MPECILNLSHISTDICIIPHKISFFSTEDGDYYRKTQLDIMQKSMDCGLFRSNRYIYSTTPESIYNLENTIEMEARDCKKLEYQEVCSQTNSLRKGHINKT